MGIESGGRFERESEIFRDRPRKSGRAVDGASKYTTPQRLAEEKARPYEGNASRVDPRDKPIFWFSIRHEADFGHELEEAVVKAFVLQDEYPGKKVALVTENGSGRAKIRDKQMKLVEDGVPTRKAVVEATYQTALEDDPHVGTIPSQEAKKTIANIIDRSNPIFQSQYTDLDRLHAHGKAVAKAHGFSEDAGGIVWVEEGHDDGLSKRVMHTPEPSAISATHAKNYPEFVDFKYGEFVDFADMQHSRDLDIPKDVCNVLERDDVAACVGWRGALHKYPIDRLREEGYTVEHIYPGQEFPEGYYPSPFLSVISGLTQNDGHTPEHLVNTLVRMETNPKGFFETNKLRGVSGLQHFNKIAGSRFSAELALAEGRYDDIDIAEIRAMMGPGIAAGIKARIALARTEIK